MKKRINLNHFFLKINCLKFIFIFIITCVGFSFKPKENPNQWIRINQLGYAPGGIKVAVWCSKDESHINTFALVDSATGKIVLTQNAGKSFGAYGPFTNTYRLDFSSFKTTGIYYLKAGNAVSPVFKINKGVYNGAADFCLFYMRQQRSGFNPFLKDSCHTHDGYTMYGPMPDTTLINVWGGWHDATDYLQYVTTSATATYQLLAAYRDFPTVFTDNHLANGLDGSNGKADVLDEATWGLDWLLKMHPRKDWMFNQLADDRDHAGFRLPDKDTVNYGIGPGLGRPVYFATGKPQGLGQYKNHSTGVASTAGKFASAFALGSYVYQKTDPALAKLFFEKSLSAYQLGLDKPGVCQTAPNREPYYYEEDNWVDDMELGAAALYQITDNKKFLKQSLNFSIDEKVTPWLGADTANHYQWYPFVNFGHYELAKKADPKIKAELISFYKDGIERVWKKAKQNGFYRGIPYIWCSDNFTTCFAIQCYLYRQLSGDQQFAELEQSCFDWLFGCNPWGTSFVYGLPANGDTPTDPHSSLSFLDHYPLNGGLVDGPIYGSVFHSLRGLKLLHPDPYAAFQSDLAVYHDDAGDYSTNEPTMDGTASLIYLLAAKENESEKVFRNPNEIVSEGGIIRGDTTLKKIALVSTGDGFADGGNYFAKVLKEQNIHGSFFLTGNFYRNKKFKGIIKKLKNGGNYLGSHSDKHLLYCDWDKRDSLFVTHKEFTEDLLNGYKELKNWGIDKGQAHYFLPPYEWYNDSIAQWTKEMGLQLVDFTPGTRSNADYTYPEMGKKYLSADTLLHSILQYEIKSTNGLNGFILIIHLGTDPRRTANDKLYAHLPELIKELKARGYQFVRIDELL